jgi:hypothetical protein
MAKAFGLHIEAENQDLKSYPTENSEEQAAGI